MLKYFIKTAALLIALLILGNVDVQAQKPVGKIKNGKVDIRIDADGIETFLIKNGYDALSNIYVHYEPEKDDAMLHIFAIRKDKQREMIAIKLQVAEKQLWFPKPSFWDNDSYEWALLHYCSRNAEESFSGVYEISCKCTSETNPKVPNHTVSTIPAKTLRQLYSAI